MKTIEIHPPQRQRRTEALSDWGIQLVCNDLPRLKAALAHGLPVVLGFLVTNGFASTNITQEIVPISGPDDVIINDNGNLQVMLSVLLDMTMINIL